MTGFGNTGNLLLAVIGSVCHSENNPFGYECNSKGVAYVSLSQRVAVILFYTLVYHMMEPPMEYYEIVQDENEIEEELPLNDISRPLLVEAEWPGIEVKETEHSKTPFIARIFKSISAISSSSIPDFDVTAESSGNSFRSIRSLAEPRVFRRIRIVAEQTPTIASLLAIIIGTVPQLKTFFFGYDAPLSFIIDSL